MVILEEIACLANFHIYKEFLKIRNNYPDYVSLIDVIDMFRKMPEKLKQDPEYEPFKKAVTTPLLKDALRQIRRRK